MNRLGLAAGLGLLLAGAVAGTVLFAGGTPGSLPGVSVRGKTGQVLVMKSANQAAGDPNLTWVRGNLIIAQDGGGVVATSFGFGESGVSATDNTGGFACTLNSGESGLGGGIICSDNLSNAEAIRFVWPSYVFTAGVDIHGPATTQCPYTVLRADGGLDYYVDCDNSINYNLSPVGMDYSVSPLGQMEIANAIEVDLFYPDGGFNLPDGGDSFIVLDVNADATATGSPGIRAFEGSPANRAYIEFDGAAWQSNKPFVVIANLIAPGTMPTTCATATEGSTVARPGNGSTTNTKTCRCTHRSTGAFQWIGTDNVTGLIDLTGDTTTCN